MNNKIMFIGVCALLIGATIPIERKLEVSVFDVKDLADPKHGEFTTTFLWEAANMASKAMRLASGANIAEHHHPVFDESLIVYSGKLTVWLNGKKSELHSGQIAYIPAGTVISGINESDQETIAIATWANIAQEGPLTVFGKPRRE